MIHFIGRFGGGGDHVISLKCAYGILLHHSKHIPFEYPMKTLNRLHDTLSYLTHSGLKQE